MISSLDDRTKWIPTGLVLATALAHLAWEHFNGGIRSHHFLGDPKFPAMHNGWGLLILPALAWLASASIVKRCFSRSAAIGFVGALTYGAALSISFSTGNMAATRALFFSAFAVSVLLPVYRAECILGFVLGMTFVFGPFIPTAFAFVFAAVSALVYFVLHPLFVRMLDRTRERSSIDSSNEGQR